MCDHAAHEIGLTLSIEHGQMGVEDIDPGRISNRQLDRTSDRDIAGLEYAQIPAGPTRQAESRLDVTSIEVHGQLEAWPTWLGHLEDRGTPSPDVPDVHVVLGDTGGAEVLPELGVPEASARLAFPDIEMLRRVA